MQIDLLHNLIFPDQKLRIMGGEKVIKNLRYCWMRQAREMRQARD